MSSALEQMPQPTYGLTAEQVDLYQQNGYVGPLELCSEAEMLELRDWMDRSGMFDPAAVSPIYGRAPSGRACTRDWHLVYRKMYELCTHPAFAESMASVMGPDLVLWRSQFQYKDAGGPPVAWHQDLGFPGHLLRPALNPVKNISAWLAIEPATLANGCVRVVPGTHRVHLERRIKQAERGEGLFGRRYGLEYAVDTSKAVAMVMRPGQFFLFSESMLHGSTGNPTKKRRLGLSIRVTTPDVRIYDGQDIDGTGYDLQHFTCVVMRGEDKYGYNRYAELDLIDD